VQLRATLIPVLRERLQAFSAAELSVRFERAGLPFAPMNPGPSGEMRVDFQVRLL